MKWLHSCWRTPKLYEGARRSTAPWKRASTAQQPRLRVGVSVRVRVRARARPRVRVRVRFRVRVRARDRLLLSLGSSSLMSAHSRPLT